MKNLLLSILFFSTQLFSQNLKVEPFSPNLFSQFPNVRDITISNNGNEIYFSAQSYMGELSAIVTVKKENENWSKPEIVSFSGRFNDLEPFLSPNGLKLYFASNRPINFENQEPKDYDIWYVERDSKSSKWSEPKNIGSPINTSKNEFYPAVASNGNMYFTSDWNTSKGKDDIFFSDFRNGKYTEPVSLGVEINSNGYEFNSFISPDEKILIYTCYNRKDGKGSGDLYISYKKDRNWTEAKNLAKVNSSKMDYCPFVDFNTNTLYFTSKRNATKTFFKERKNLKLLLKEFNKHENGLSRIYNVQFNLDKY